MNARFWPSRSAGRPFFLMSLGGCGDKSENSIFSAVGSYGDVAVLTPGPGLYGSLQPFLKRLGPDFTFGTKSEPLYNFQNHSGNAGNAVATTATSSSSPCATTGAMWGTRSARC